MSQSSGATRLPRSSPERYADRAGDAPSVIPGWHTSELVELAKRAEPSRLGPVSRCRHDGAAGHRRDRELGAIRFSAKHRLTAPDLIISALPLARRAIEETGRSGATRPFPAANS